MQVALGSTVQLAAARACRASQGSAQRQGRPHTASTSRQPERRGRPCPPAPSRLVSTVPGLGVLHWLHWLRRAQLTLPQPVQVQSPGANLPAAEGGAARQGPGASERGHVHSRQDEAASAAGQLPSMLSCKACTRQGCAGGAHRGAPGVQPGQARAPAARRSRQKRGRRRTRHTRQRQPGRCRQQACHGRSGCSGRASQSCRGSGQASAATGKVRAKAIFHAVWRLRNQRADGGSGQGPGQVAAHLLLPHSQSQSPSRRPPRGAPPPPPPDP